MLNDAVRRILWIFPVLVAASLITPRASWGSLIQAGIKDADRAPWLIIPPMVALGVALIGFTLLGDGLRDAFDPRTSRRGRR